MFRKAPSLCWYCGRGLAKCSSVGRRPEIFATRKKFPADRIFRRAGTSRLIPAQHFAAVLVDPKRVRFDGARVAIVEKTQALPLIDRGSNDRRGVHFNAGLSQPVFGANRLPYLPASISS